MKFRSQILKKINFKFKNMCSLFPEKSIPEGSPIATPPLRPIKTDSPKVTFHRKIKSSGYAKLKPYRRLKPDDCVQIWDIRTRDCVACLSGGHKNTSSRRSVSAEFSPCLRYVSCGSDAGHGPAIYDIRSGGEVLSGSMKKKKTSSSRYPVSIAHVSDVSFCPFRPLLVSSRHDGKLVFFSRSVFFVLGWHTRICMLLLRISHLYNKRFK